MKRYLIFLLAVGLFSCQKVHQDPEQVLFDLKLTSYKIPADGTTTDTVTVKLDPDADATRRNVRFSAYPSGKWIGGDSTISVKAVFQNGVLSARAIYQVSNAPGNITIQAKPDLPDLLNNNYLQKATLVTDPSPVTTIKLVPASTGVNSNFQNEVSLTGTLSNAKGAMSTAGSNVIFEDLLASGAPAGGVFRAAVTTSNASSQVTAFYGAGNYPVGTRITIRVTVLDSGGAKTTISDNLQLIINK